MWMLTNKKAVFWSFDSFLYTAQRCVLPLSFPVDLLLMSVINPPERKLSKRTSVHWHVKVHIFWEGHKILWNLHQLTWQYIGQIIGGDFPILWPSQNIWTLLKPWNGANQIWKSPFWRIFLSKLLFIRLLGPFEIILDNLRNFDAQNLQNLFAIYPKLKGQQYLKKNVWNVSLKKIELQRPM